MTPLCLCRGNSRFYSTKCQNRDAHGVHSEQDWYSENPIYMEPYVRSARQYRDQIMAARSARSLMDRLWGTFRDVPPQPESTFTPKVRQPWVPPYVPEPVVVSTELDEDHEDHLPPNARKLIRLGAAAGWDVRVTFALGHEINDNGSPRTLPIWRHDVDEGSGREHKTKIGESDPGPQPSVAVRLLDRTRMGQPDAMFLGVWTRGVIENGKWSGARFDTGMIMWPFRLAPWAALLSSAEATINA